jgi:rhodanese-related sulfurtransferase
MFNGLFGGKPQNGISAADLKAKLDNKENFLLFDVRTPEEYSGGHIDHSISLPLQHLEANISRYARSKNTEIVVYCQSGARSSRAASVLSALGYTSVKNLGGIMSWPYAVVR